MNSTPDSKRNACPQNTYLINLDKVAFITVYPAFEGEPETTTVSFDSEDLHLEGNQANLFLEQVKHRPDPSDRWVVVLPDEVETPANE
jgi:hypothetical protein